MTWRDARPLLGTAVVLAFAATAHADDANPAGSLDRATVVRAAVAHSPGVRAASQRARATNAAADAEGRLPPPEAMVQVWAVPLARPWAVGDAQMAMIGVQQELPAPGSRGAREEARGDEARADDAMAAERARRVANEAEHAFADYVESTARRRVHVEHHDVGARMLRLAEARHAAGGSLVEAAQLEAELAKVDADVATDAAKRDAARARINALLGRDPGAPLGEPVEDEPAMPAWPLAQIAAKAREARPDVRAAEALRAAREGELRAADREATWPAFKVGASYFAPVGPAPAHGYGVNASMTLPWLWGGASARRAAEEHRATAARTEIEAQRLEVDVEVASTEATARSAARRLRVLVDRARPASRRAFEAAWGGYESGRADLMAALVASRAVVDAEEQIVMARAALDHALADLDAAAGVPVPRAPLGPDASDAEGKGGDHAH